MSSLTIITGTLEDARDPFGRLDTNQLYYESWEEDPDDPDSIIISRDRAPVVYKGFDKFDIVQTMGCGKTLKAMDILANKAYNGGVVLANLGLIWNNIDIPEKDWKAGVNSFDDLWKLNHCTVVFDDFSILVPSWNTEEANTISPIVNNSGKADLNIIITAQQEVQVPPKIRRVATDWIVPIIRVRDFTKKTPRNDGYPMEMICLHFDGTKVLKYISDPIINLDVLFKTYKTIERAGTLNREGETRTKPGWQLENEFHCFLQNNAPEEEWVHIDKVFDEVCESERYAFDVKSVGEDAKVRLDTSKDLSDHLRLIRTKGYSGYLAIKKEYSWGFVPITESLNYEVKGKKIPLKRLNKSMLSFKAVFGHSEVLSNESGSILSSHASVNPLIKGEI
jgi:hypothetical protein